MRDYPNGGFFFIDAAPIQAAGENGLKIDGIFEDAKRAVDGGKVFVLTNYSPDEGVLATGTMTAASTLEGVQADCYIPNGVITVVITPEDVVTITME